MPFNMVSPEKVGSDFLLAFTAVYARETIFNTFLSSFLSQLQASFFGVEQQKVCFSVIISIIGKTLPHRKVCSFTLVLLLGSSCPVFAFQLVKSGVSSCN